MIDKLNVGQKFIITYRPNTHNGEVRPKLKDNKRTRQITRRAEWTNKSRALFDCTNNRYKYITYYDLDQQGYRCAVGKVWITLEI
tara:strand:+ start:1526 stop:1780 length:255 start_codon:yes stop_codon:yes gene_type:complete